MVRHSAVIPLLVLLGCNGNKGEGELAARFIKAADFLDVKFERMQSATEPGQFCYPLIDGYVRHRVQSLGVQIAKEVRDFEAYFDFVTIVMDVYTTRFGDRFNALAQKYQAWKSGAYENAIQACQACARDGRDEDWPIRPDLSSCRVP